MSARRSGQNEPEETEAEQQQRINNLMWRDRERRARAAEPAWKRRRPTGRPPNLEEQQRQRRAAEKKAKEDKDFNNALYVGAGVFAAIAVISLLIGIGLNKLDPTTSEAAAKAVANADLYLAIGIVGMILIIPAFMLAHHFQRR